MRSRLKAVTGLKWSEFWSVENLLEKNVVHWVLCHCFKVLINILSCLNKLGILTRKQNTKERLVYFGIKLYIFFYHSMWYSKGHSGRLSFERKSRQHQKRGVFFSNVYFPRNRVDFKKTVQTLFFDSREPKRISRQKKHQSFKLTAEIEINFLLFKSIFRLFPGTRKWSL